MYETKAMRNSSITLVWDTSYTPPQTKVLPTNVAPSVPVVVPQASGIIKVLWQIDSVVSWVMAIIMLVAMVLALAMTLGGFAYEFGLEDTSQFQQHSASRFNAGVNAEAFALCEGLAAMRRPVVWLGDSNRCIYLERGTSDSEWQLVRDEQKKGTLTILSR